MLLTRSSFWQCDSPDTLTPNGEYGTAERAQSRSKRVPSERVYRFLPYSLTVRSLHWPGLSSVCPPSSVLHFSTPGMVGRVLICFVVAARPLCEWHWHLSRCFAVDKIKSKPAIAGIVRSVWMCVCLCLSHSLSVCVTQRGPFAADFFTNGVTNFKQVISACCLWASICARATGETDNERERVSERATYKEVHNEIYVQYRKRDRQREGEQKNSSLGVNFIGNRRRRATIIELCLKIYNNSSGLRCDRLESDNITLHYSKS